MTQRPLDSNSGSFTTYSLSATTSTTITTNDNVVDVITHPNKVAQRVATVQSVYNMLIQPDINAVMLMGIKGVGKSTLAGLIYNYAENQRNNSTQGRSLWFTIKETDSFYDLARRIFRALGEPEPDFSRDREADHARLLYGLLHTTNKAGLIVLNQFENFLDEKTRCARLDRPCIDEWLDIINTSPMKSRILLTSHVLPQKLPVRGLVRPYTETWLKVDEGAEWLDQHGIKGRLTEREELVKQFGGHGFALNFLVQSTVGDDTQITLPELLRSYSFVKDSETVATQFLDHIYHDLLTAQHRAVLRALSIYREPVPVEAIQLLAGGKREDLHPLLRDLEARQLVQSKNLRFDLHPLVKSYAQNHFNDPDRASSSLTLQQQRNDSLTLSTRDRDTLQQAHKKAASYYQQQRSSDQRSRKKIDDIQPVIETVWQLCQGGSPAEAFQLMRQENLFSDLKRMGEHAVLLDLCTMLLPVSDWQTASWQEAFISRILGEVNDELGRLREARRQFERSLPVYRGSAKDGGPILTQLGRICADLGEPDQAHDYFRQALRILGTTDEKKLSAVAFRQQGDLFDKQGDKEQARKNYAEAIRLSTEAGHVQGGAEALIKLGDSYLTQEDIQRAQQAYEQALRRLWSQLPKDERLEASVYNKLGDIFSKQEKWDEARKSYETAHDLYQRVGDRRGMALSLNKQGDALSELDRRNEALQCYNKSLDHFQRAGDRGGEGESLNHLGRVNSELSSRQVAIHFYNEAMIVFIEVNNGVKQGWVYYNLGMVYHNLPERGKEKDDYLTAIEYYDKALEILRGAIDRKAEGITFMSRGEVYYELGKIADSDQLNCFLQACANFKQAFHIHREVKNLLDEGVTLHEAGVVFYHLGRREDCLGCLFCARGIFDRLPAPQYHKDKLQDSLATILQHDIYQQLKSEIEPQSCRIAEQALS